MPTQTIENYLKALYHLHQEGEDISMSALGEEMNVSIPTANDMVKKLMKKGWVDYQKYKPVKLTEAGLQLAVGIIRKHRLSEMFLSEIMHFGWEEVHEIAEQLEHIRSDKLFQRMDEILGYPSVDPHGSPIPDEMGNINRPKYVALSEVEAGSRVKIMALRDSTSKFLQYLNRKKVALNTTLVVKAIDSYDLSYTVSFDDNSSEQFSAQVCDKLMVALI